MIFRKAGRSAHRGAQVWFSPEGERRHGASLEGVAATCIAMTDVIHVGSSKARLFRLIDGALEPLEAFDVAEGHDTWYTPSGGLDSRGSETAQVVAAPYVTAARKKYLLLSSSGFPEHE